MTMRLNDPSAYRRAEELDMLSELLDLRGLRVLELGCGNARTTRALVNQLGAQRVTATEVDRIQHEKNLALADLPGVTFRFGGAEHIADASYDLVCMFKSLHHVPIAALDTALAEIHRVLVPHGRLYVSEPVYWGPFSHIMRLIHEERAERAAAFAALERAVADGRFAAEQQCFFEAASEYPDWASFADQYLHATHTLRALTSTQVDTIRAAFEAHVRAHGSCFLKPHRVNVLRRVP